MARFTTTYICQQCGHSSSKWFGKCPECNTWGSLVETVDKVSKKKGKLSKKEGSSTSVSLSKVTLRKTERITTKIKELDRVLGGGLVDGQVVLIAGEPGIGKSTILLQVSDKLGNTLYVSGEESINQIKIRADRLGIGKGKKKPTISLMEETDVDIIINSIKALPRKPNALVIDSIQTMSTEDLTGMAGSVGQVRESAFRIVRLAKELKVPTFIVGHVTKEGTVAGPAVLAHVVDTVLWFEGDKSLTLRMLRAMKNRFGPTDEIGIFSMEDKGLISQINPEKLFLTGIRKKVSGSVTTSVMRGSRPILIEIQSLIIPSKLAYPKRIAQGIDAKRLEMLIAVLARRCGLALYDYDCFVNVTGGISVRNDPSADFAICMSLASSFFDKPLSKKNIVIGEVGLSGDIREVIAQEKRIKEARRLGYTSIISSRAIKYLQEAIGKYLK